jgi:hypothetical protein
MHADAKQQHLVIAMAALPVVKQIRLKKHNSYWKAHSLRR